MSLYEAKADVSSAWEFEVLEQIVVFLSACPSKKGSPRFLAQKCKRLARSLGHEFLAWCWNLATFGPPAFLSSLAWHILMTRSAGFAEMWGFRLGAEALCWIWSRGRIWVTMSSTLIFFSPVNEF